ncbi:MAG: hypothetical protein ACYTDU_16950 [Planctomycetota bacterium]|jgi:hypothetical protein
MFGLAGYFIFVPPPGFEDSIGHRFTIPFVLVACAYMVLENLRTRIHLAQLVGALRSLMGRTGTPATPEVKREAIEILLKSLRSDNETARQAAARQLGNLTGQDFGEDAKAWEEWWARNKADFGKPQA